MTADAIHIWHFPVDRLGLVHNRTKLTHILSADELRRLDQFQVQYSKNEFLAGRFAIRNILSHYRPEVQPGSWVFNRNSFGKPSISNQIENCKLNFNISHSAGRIAIAISETACVGIDIEKLDRGIEFRVLAKEFFAVSEYQSLILLPESQQAKRFFELWTLKESYLKCKGVGLFEPLDRVLINLDEIKDCKVGQSDAGFSFALSERGSNWQFWLREDQDFQVALTIERPDPSRFVEVIDKGEFKLSPEKSLFV